MSGFSQDNPLKQAHSLQSRGSLSSPHSDSNDLSIDAAMMFRLHNHPHIAVERGHLAFASPPTPIRCCTSTGRFCGARCMKFDPFCEGRESAFSHYGSGVSVYFKNQKWLIWMFFLMSILAIPMIFINASGLDREETFYTNPLAISTLAKFYANPNSTVYNVTFNGETILEVPIDILGPIYVFCDVAAVFIFIVSWFWVRRYEKKEDVIVDRAHLTADDFTVYIPSVPSKTTVGDITETVYNVTQSSERPNGIEIAEIFLVEDQMALVKSLMEHGRLQLQRARLTGRLKRLERFMQRYPHETGSCNSIPRERRKLEKKINIIEVRCNALRSSNTRLAKTTNVVAAFVTFQKEADAEYFAEMYPNTLASWCCQPRSMRLRGSRIRVYPAPPPSSIIWENLDLQSTAQCIRQSFTAFLILLMLVGSFILLMLASFKQREFNSHVTNMSVCPLGEIFVNYTYEHRSQLRRGYELQQIIDLYGNEQRLDVDGDGHADPDYSRSYKTCWCVLDSPFVTLDTFDTYYKSSRYVQNLTYPYGVNELYQLGSGGNGRMLQTALPYTGTVGVPLPEYYYLNFDLNKDPFLENYGTTRELYDFYVTHNSTAMCTYQACPKLFSLDVFRTISEPMCETWWAERASAIAVTIAASVAIALVNMLLQRTMRALTSVEGHHSFGDLNSSLAVRLLAATFFNTSVLTIIINASIASIDWLPLDDLAGDALNSANSYSDFTPSWVGQIGPQLMTTMIINVLTPHLVPLLSCVMYHSKVRSIKRQIPKTILVQSDLNEQFLGASMDFAARYALMWNTLFSTFIFTTALPAMFPIALASFFVSYWVDKTLFRNYYRTPVSFSVNIQQRMTSLIPLLVILKLAISAWQISNKYYYVLSSYFDPAKITAVVMELNEEVQTGVSDSVLSDGISRLTAPMVLPFVVSLAVVLLAIILYGLLSISTKFFKGFLNLLTCGKCNNIDLDGDTFEIHQDDITFEMARKGGRIQGIDTFNMLCNPQVQKAFRISDELARSCKSLSELARFHDTHLRTNTTQSIDSIDPQGYGFKSDSRPTSAAGSKENPNNAYSGHNISESNAGDIYNGFGGEGYENDDGDFDPETGEYLPTNHAYENPVNNIPQEEVPISENGLANDAPPADDGRLIINNLNYNEEQKQSDRQSQTSRSNTNGSETVAVSMSVVDV